MNIDGGIELSIKEIHNHDGLCWSCLGNVGANNITTIEIPALGYGGMFDSFSSKIQLCKTCKKRTKEEWWNLNRLQCIKGEDVLYEMYEHEEEISSFINTLPMCSQELFYNTCSSEQSKMNPQDWIDFTIGIMSDEKLEEYGFTLKQYVE